MLAEAISGKLTEVQQVEPVVLLLVRLRLVVTLCVSSPYDEHTADDGNVWLVVTTEVKDSQYLSQSFVTSTHFKKQADADGWNPQPCAAK